MNKRVRLHPGCTPEAWSEFLKAKAADARVVKLKGRRVIGYAVVGGGYAFGFLNVHKWKIYCHCINVSEDAIIAMASIMHYIQRSEAPTTGKGE